MVRDLDPKTLFSLYAKPVFPASFVEKLHFLHVVDFVKINCLYMCGLVSELCSVLMISSSVLQPKMALT